VERDGGTLVDRIERLVLSWIAEGGVRPGGKAPSIRALAQRQGVSPFTVSQAYDRLVACGHLEARPRSGFRVRRPGPGPVAKEAPPPFSATFDYIWQVLSQITEVDCALNVSSGQLPPDWTDHAHLQRRFKAMLGTLGQSLSRYDEPAGDLSLRRLLARRLDAIGITASEDHILMTHGAMQALDLLIRYHLRPGETVLVDDPGYFNLLGNLHMQGVRLLGVPRTPDGPDLAALDSLAATHAPKLFFTQSVLQTPTGSSITTHVAHRLLQIAERRGFHIVEDDAYAGLSDAPHSRLAAMDQLERVIYVGSFSKTISPALRVGFLAASKELTGHLTNVKILSCLGSNPVAEKFVFQVLSDGAYRKSLEQLRARLTDGHHQTMRTLEKLGFEAFCQPLAGKFLWLRHPDCPDSGLLAEAAAKERIVLAPGKVFRPGMEATPWFRVNVAFGGHPLLLRFLDAFFKG
jgi:DNA-binding transcriptional MocR family regulator